MDSSLFPFLDYVMILLIPWHATFMSETLVTTGEFLQSSPGEKTANKSLSNLAPKNFFDPC